ncbi:MAG: c-type cytochrome [Bacteroidota bacterium]|nr:c-type cytochrome [Bacteroidota bacterium]
MKRWVARAVIGSLLLAFTRILDDYSEDKPVPIPPSPQRSGDVKKGYAYLTTGDYLKSGIPYGLFLIGTGRNRENYLQRDSPNTYISHEYTAVAAPNGELVVAPNCLQCHSEVFNNKLYIGLGNSLIDFTDRRKLNPRNAAIAESLLKRGDPRRLEAAEPFIKAMKAIAGQLYTEVRGVNSADRLADLLVSHRDPVTFRWSDEPLMDVPQGVVPTDVPAWWLLKKKNAMFYNGFGRGDFGRFLMASNLLTVSDTSEAREVDNHINDVLAYIYSLEPPKYPYPVNTALARQGSVLFVQHCSKCHGNYGHGGDYPNLLIPESLIGTDSLLFKANYQSPQFIGWFNKSWFAQGDHPARLEAFDGYIAPPLDGIWITAPYLHNGSVPDLEGVLNSKARPRYWSRDYANLQYDYTRVGWKYSRMEAPGGTTVYNTTLPGYGNYGHSFGDQLTEKERRAIIEYLKTL